MIRDDDEEEVVEDAADDVSIVEIPIHRPLIFANPESHAFGIT